MNKGVIGLFAIAILMLTIATANIGMAKAESEDSFERVVPIEIGKSYTGKFSGSPLSRIATGADWYVIQGKSSNELKIEVSSSAGADVYLYNEDREELNHKSGQSKTKIFLSWLSSCDRYYYIIVETYSKGSYSLIVSSLEKYDANSGVDAGDTRESAIRISSGKYKGFLAGFSPLHTKYDGDDKNDLYVFHLKEDQTVDVKVTPTLKGSISLYLFDQDWEEIDHDRSKNDGAIVKASWKAPSSQDTYILLTSDPDRWGGRLLPRMKGGPYTLEVDIEGVEPTPTSTHASSTTPIPDGKEGTPGFEALFTIAGILVVAYLIIKRCKA